MKPRHDWVRKVIHWELCKKFEFDHSSRTVLNNEKHIIFCDFEIPAYHITPGRRPDLVIVNKTKENQPNCKLCRPGKSLSKNQRIQKKKMWRILRSCQRIKKAMEDEDNGGTSCNWCTWNNPPRLNKRTRRVGNRRASGDHPKYSLADVAGEYWEKSWWPEDTCSHRDSSEILSDKVGVKNSQWIIIMIIIKR